MRSKLHRTFKTRNPPPDQTKEQKQLALVNYMTENENRQVDQNALKRPCCQESCYRNKICCSNAACCIFMHSNSERFNRNWNCDWIASTFVLWRQGSKLTLANSQNLNAFYNLRVRKIATSKRLRVRIIPVYQTFGKNLLVISPVCQQKKILLAKLCKWTKKLTSSPVEMFIR